MKNIYIDAYLKRLEEISNDSESEEEAEAIGEKVSPIPQKLQNFIEFGKETLCISKLSTNVRKPKDKRQINVNTMEYDIGTLGIESNEYIIVQGTKILTKLAQDKES